MSDKLDILKSPMGDGSSFTNPWEDLASQYAPKTIMSALELCEFLYINDPTYKRASEKIVNYFLTEAKYTGQSGEEQEKFQYLMDKDFDLMGSLQSVGYDFMCFSGDTKVVTENGIFPIKDLTGQTVSVLSQDGIYRPAEFKSFGYQELYRVDLGDDETILTTAEHEWPVVDTNLKHKIVPTTQLKGNKIKRTVAPRPPKNDDYYDGLRHGIVYGDGSTYNKTRKTSKCNVALIDEEKKYLQKFFEDYSFSQNEKSKNLHIHGLPQYLKTDLPHNTASASYWYGFVIGILSTDGNVNNNGDVVLTHKNRNLLDAIKDQLPRIGMLGGKIVATTPSALHRILPYGRKIDQITMHHLMLKRNFLIDQDFERHDQLEKFLSKPQTDYGRLSVVKDVQATGVTAEVFCCVEMETHTFVVGNAILTKQCYGNSFSSLSFPFVRSIACKECKTERNINHIEEFKYDLKTGKIDTYCPKCGSDKPHEINDYKKKDSKAIKMIRWNPKKMHIRANRLTADMEYWTEVPLEIKTAIKTQDKFYLRTTPKAFLEATRLDKNFKFNKTHLHHMKEPFLAGLWLGGWGLPSILSSFKNFFRLQILRRYNETLMMDYIVPLRIISPAQGSYQEGNSIYNNLMREWRTQMQDAVVRHRKDGSDWNFFPFPITYQAVGGEGRQLAPVDLIENEEDRLLNGRGIPPELYRSTMLLQAAPIALRVFERTWSSLVRGMNLLAQSTSDSISKYMGSGDFDTEIESVKIIDDIENKSWRLQAMSAGQLSKETAMGPMGIKDVGEEFKRILDEQRREQEMAQESQQEMQMSQMGLGNSEQGMEEGAGGGEGEVTPENVNAQGDQIARQLLAMDEATRRRELLNISRSNDTLHAVVLKKMDVMRNQARSMGMQSALPQVINPGGNPNAGQGGQPAQ